MGNEFGKSNVVKGNDGGGGSGWPRHAVIEKRLCITVPEAAAMLGLSKNFVYKLVNERQLPVIIFGKRKLIPRAALEKMLEKAEIESRNGSEVG